MNMPILDWHLNERYAPADVILALGRIPEFISPMDERPAWEQIDARYGWNPKVGGKFRLDQHGYLYYPGDPVMEPIATAFLRDEQIYVYAHGWVCIVQPGGSFSLARCD